MCRKQLQDKPPADLSLAQSVLLVSFPSEPGPSVPRDQCLRRRQPRGTTGEGGATGGGGAVAEGRSHSGGAEPQRRGRSHCGGGGGLQGSTPTSWLDPAFFNSPTFFTLLQRQAAPGDAAFPGLCSLESYSRDRVSPSQAMGLPKLLFPGRVWLPPPKPFPPSLTACLPSVLLQRGGCRGD